MYLDETKSNEKDKKPENNINNSFRNKIQILEIDFSILYLTNWNLDTLMLKF